MDVLSPEQRSRCMSRIRGTDTKPELKLRKALWHRGWRYRLHCKELPGRPDIVFVSQGVAVFVDGCFFHGCPKHYSPPESNAEFWSRKIEANKRRDAEVSAELEADGWHVLRIWEHEIDEDVEDACAAVEALLE